MEDGRRPLQLEKIGYQRSAGLDALGQMPAGSRIAPGAGPLLSGAMCGMMAVAAAFRPSAFCIRRQGAARRWTLVTRRSQNGSRRRRGGCSARRRRLRVARAALQKRRCLTVAKIAASPERNGRRIDPIVIRPIDAGRWNFGIEAGRFCEHWARVSTTRRTAREEALTAVAIAALTIYDMCKAVDKTMVLGAIRVTGKSKE